jgi:hypothetical protein
MTAEPSPDKVVRYRTYIIEPHPNLLADGRWDSSLTIKRSFGSGMDEWPRCGAPTFTSHDEAVRYCIRYGQQIIDGDYPNAALI